MRKNLIAVLVFVVVMVGCYFAFRFAYYGHGYTTPETDERHFRYLVRMVDDCFGLRVGDVLIVDQKYLWGEDYGMFISRKPVPVLIWRDGWRGVQIPAGHGDSFWIERGTFKILNALEIRHSGVSFSLIPHRSLPDIRKKPIRRNPETQQVVQDSAEYAFLDFAVGDDYIYLTMETQPDRDGEVWELNGIYWVNDDRSVQVRINTRRGVLTD